MTWRFTGCSSVTRWRGVVVSRETQAQCACRNARARRKQLTVRLIARACAEMSPLSLSYNQLIVSPSWLQAVLSSAYRPSSSFRHPRRTTDCQLTQILRHRLVCFTSRLTASDQDRWFGFPGNSKQGLKKYKSVHLAYCFLSHSLSLAFCKNSEISQILNSEIEISFWEIGSLKNARNKK